jgi:hypothetical protein
VPQPANLTGQSGTPAKTAASRQNWLKIEALHVEAIDVPRAYFFRIYNGRRMDFPTVNNDLIINLRQPNES